VPRVKRLLNRYRACDSALFSLRIALIETRLSVRSHLGSPKGVEKALKQEVVRPLYAEYESLSPSLLGDGSHKNTIVEVGGIEPPSGDLVPEASPGADGVLMSGPRRAPTRSACPIPIGVPRGPRATPAR